jgi:hypothetical protein
VSAASEQTKRLAEAAAQRTIDAERRGRDALRQLDRQAAAISFVSVAQRARVSRALLYVHADRRGEIEALRHSEGGVATRLPVRERARDASIRGRLRAALEENQRQRLEIAGRREELAIAHGRVRELELDRRVRRG